MKTNCPNLNELAGTLIGAKLISIAGSLRKLAMFPASTVQLLGAEKALFRHMKNKKRYLPPKYGVLHEHKYIQQNPKKYHGKIARLLADKIAIAVKIDYFKGDFKGDKLKKQVEEKIREMKK
jgi:nucleolar protein 56